MPLLHLDESVFRGRQAVVTGASSGIGADIARRLAAAGCHVLLVARRGDRLRELAAELDATGGERAAAGPDVDVCALDLRAPGAVDRLTARCAALPRPVDVLVHSAGFGQHGAFLDQDAALELAMIDLNAVLPTRLCRAFLPAMCARGSGYVLLVASNAAYQPVPGYATYAATKAYLSALGEALHRELAGSGVACTVLSPGTTETEFFEVAGHTRNALQRRLSMQSAAVARAGLRGLARRRALVVPGLGNKLALFLTRLIPRQLAAAVAERLVRASAPGDDKADDDAGA